MRKKNFAVLVLICVFTSLFLGIKPTLAGQASLSLSPITGGPYQIGSTFSLNIWAKTGGANVDTIRASLTFPASLLEAQSVSLGSTYSAPSGGNYINNNNGTIYWGAGAYGGTTSDAAFAAIIFKAKSAGTATISFASDSLMLSAGQAVPFIKANGTYTIGAATQTPAPAAPQPVPGPAAPTPQPSPQTTTPTSAQTAQRTISNEIYELPSKPELQPIFSGKTSVGNAPITIEIDDGLLNGSVTSDADGNWQWQMSQSLAPGIYKIKITAAHPEDGSITISEIKEMEIAITEALEPLFDVILGVKKESKKIFSGDNLKIDMKLVNFGENIQESTITNIELTYLIENSNREEVLRKTEKRQVRGRESSFVKELAMPKNLKPGQYFISAKMTYGDKQEASSSDTFKIKNDFWKKNNVNIIVSLAVVMGIMIIIIISNLWKKSVRSKKTKTRIERKK